MKIVVNEQAEKASIYEVKLGFQDMNILCHCSYFLLYDTPDTENHWKQELFALVAPFKRATLKSGDKRQATEDGLVVDGHGEHFSEEREAPDGLFHAVYDSEDDPHKFDCDMGLGKNLDVYFEALDRFYYEFLIPWIADTDKDPDRQELYAAVDRYLIGARVDMAHG